jgi:hypothetical protein
MLKSNLLALSLVALLSACASGPPPIMAPLIQKVEIPIPVPCKVAIPKAPTFNFDELNIDQDIYEKVRALLVDRKLHLGYEVELSAALNACVK